MRAGYGPSRAEAQRAREGVEEMPNHLVGHRPFALAAASGAVAAGCLLLLLSGAPIRMPVMNFAALLIGLTTLLLLRGAATLLPRPVHADWVLLAASLLVPLTALFGAEADGVAR